MLFFHLHQMWDVLLATFPDTNGSPLRCCGKLCGSSKALRHWVWPVHLCQSCRSIWWVESRLAEHWTMLSFVVSRQTSGQQLCQNGKVSLFNWTVHYLTTGGFLEESKHTAWRWWSPHKFWVTGVKWCCFSRMKLADSLTLIKVLLCL